MATVFIKTPWGLGSGFFIDEECRIITNKHVVQLSEAQTDELRTKTVILEFMIKRDDARVTHVEEMIGKLSDADVIRDLNRRRETARQKIEKMKDDYQKLSEFFDKIESGVNTFDFKVILFDKTEHQILRTTISDEYDLALLELDEDGCPCLLPAASTNLPTG